MRQLTTRTRLENAAYPCLQVFWRENEDGLRWRGEATLWLDEDRSDPGVHVIEVGQTLPLGGIHAFVDPSSHGAWAMTRFEGTGITERDLQWAAAWGAVEIKRKREALSRTINLGGQQVAGRARP